MFGNLGEMAALFKKAKDMQRNMAEMKEEMARSEYSASSPDSGVTVLVSGDFRIKNITVTDAARSAADLNERITATVNAALDAAKSAMQSRMKEISGGLNIPGLF